MTVRTKSNKFHRQLRDDKEEIFQYLRNMTGHNDDIDHSNDVWQEREQYQQMDNDENGIFQCLLFTVQLFCIPVHILYATGNNFVQLLFYF